VGEIAMAIQLLRGHVKDVSSPDNHGAADCHIGKYNVKVYSDLVSTVGKGDDLLLAGELRNDIFHAMAVKNIDKGKTAQIDCTNNILLMGMSGFICMLGFVLALKAINTGGVVQSIDLVLAFVGLIGMGITLRRLFLITRASNWVTRADI
jgi:hypothetical protein